VLKVCVQKLQLNRALEETDDAKEWTGAKIGIIGNFSRDKDT
jgi:hypothetical protein